MKIENFDDNGGDSSGGSNANDDEAGISIHQAPNEAASYNTALHINGSVPQGSPAAVVQLTPGGPSVRLYHNFLFA